MTIAAVTYTAFDSIGNREQLSDIIYNIAPTNTPFLSGCKKGKASAVFFEWQTDTLAAAAANAQLDGDDIASYTAVVPTVRIGNRTQISRKLVAISGTQQAILKAGRKDELAYQITKNSKALKRDQEFALTQNSTAVTGSTTVAKQTRGLEGWVGGTNVVLASAAGSPAAAAAATNTAAVDSSGTAAFTEAHLKSAAQKVFESGGEADMLMVGSANKQVVSTFTGNSTRMDKGEDGKVFSATSVYVTDFGDIKIVPNRFQRSRTAFLLDMDMFQVNTLRPYQVETMGKTGDADKRMLIVEYGLESKQEAASAAIRDLA